MANSVESWIVNFHGVGSIKRPFDPGEENVWLEEKTFCSMLDEIVGVQGIEITFDDGNASDIEIAISALLSRGLKASFFIPVGKLGTPGFLQESNIRTLIDAGMEIGSHGWAHRSWRKLAEDDLAQELIESRKRLQDITGVDVLSAACPFGDYDSRVLKSLRNAGYREIYTSDRGPAISTCLLKPRNTAHATDVPESVLRERSDFRNGLVRRARMFYKRKR